MKKELVSATHAKLLRPSKGLSLYGWVFLFFSKLKRNPRSVRLTQFTEGRGQILWRGEVRISASPSLGSWRKSSGTCSGPCCWSAPCLQMTAGASHSGIPCQNCCSRMAISGSEFKWWGEKEKISHWIHYLCFRHQGNNLHVKKLASANNLK